MIKRIIFPQEITGLRKEFCIGELLNGVEITQISFEGETWVIFGNKESKKKIAERMRNATPEHRFRLSLANLGRKATEEQKRKISEKLTGRIVSQETKDKISIAQKGKPHKKHSQETKDKMSASHKKRTHFNSTEKARIKSAELRRGTHLTEKHKQAIGKANSGKNCHMWQGGISFEPYCPKFNNDLKKRIRAFFEHQCICCGKHENEHRYKLHCHHVEYNKDACCNGKPVHFAALCIKHHMQSNYERTRWESMLHRIIDEIYDGKSYYKQEEWRNIVGQT